MTRGNLPPLETLVGKRVRWRPRDMAGKRTPALIGDCTAFDAKARTLTITVWPDEHIERTYTVPTTSGPFTIVGQS